jgi:glutamine amidotransferase
MAKGKGQKQSVAIIDYGVGNLRSVEKAFVAGGYAAVVSSDEKVLQEADALVLPGVGAFKACMNGLKESGFDELVRERVAEGTPLLGVCVGMQMLFEGSEEFGWNAGLGFLKGTVKRFSLDQRAPHVGWNSVKIENAHPLFNGIEDNSFFYFVHSFYCEAADENVAIGSTEYGVNYASVVASGNVCGVQFHPEKSQTVGLKLLKNFASTGLEFRT